MSGVIAAIVMVAIVTVFVLPREGSPVPTVINTIGKYAGGAISSMLGTN